MREFPLSTATITAVENLSSRRSLGPIKRVGFPLLLLSLTVWTDFLPLKMIAATVHQP